MKQNKIVKVTQDADIDIFRGKIVEYICAPFSSYYINDNNYYLINNSSVGFFGLVSQDRTDWFSWQSETSPGYNISKLLKRSAKDTMCALQNEQMAAHAENGILMKLADKEALSKIFFSNSRYEVEWLENKGLKKYFS